MLMILFLILLFLVFGKLLALSIKAAWGVTKILFHLVCLPLVLIAMVVGGLIYVALPILIVIGIVSWVSGSKI